MESLKFVKFAKIAKIAKIVKIVKIVEIVKIVDFVDFVAGLRAGLGSLAGLRVAGNICGVTTPDPASQ